MLPEPYLDLPSETKIEKSVLQGSLIFRSGEKSTGFFHLLEGEVRMIRYAKDGADISIHRAFSGQSFAEASLYSDTYHCDAVALKACSIVKFDKALVLHHLETNAVFAMKMTAHLAGQVQDYRRLLELRAIRSAQERVYAGIAEGWLKGSVLSFASQLGLTHEATYRALSNLTKRGQLTKTGRGKYGIPSDSR
ncbi:Crp/Fnr family transcriptional regulator [Pseudahrensia aquimaris]|uniref:Crp/Fnr family transcriptional regulator n=1 Tax=Pseudahrensia aquimaris TaxID=744461 RepID=A0ABW3FL54_9HYPH